MDGWSAPSLELRRAVFMRDITICVCVLPMYIFFPDRSAFLLSFFFVQFLVVLLFTEMHIHKEVDKGT